MKITSLFLLTACILLSCSKDPVYITVTSTSKLDFKISEVVNDSTLVLQWKPYTGANFKKYVLMRSAYYWKNGVFDFYNDAIDSSTDVQHGSFREQAMPFTYSLYYNLVVKDEKGNVLQGNDMVFYTRPNTIVIGSPTDALYNRQRKWVYITDYQNIYIVNCANGRQVANKKMPVPIGYCSLGEWGGSTELYVPTQDGWLQILDATTLAQKDKIYIAGLAVASVVAQNGKLYVGSSDLTQAGINKNCIKVYDRATKALLGRGGYYDKTRLLYLEGSSNEFIDLTTNVSPIQLAYYQFADNGALLTQKEDTYHGNYQMDVNIVRSFPDGSRFITSGYGSIFNKSLVFDHYVKEFGTYVDFAFNNDGSLIYAADGRAQNIDAISYPGNTVTKKYPTTLVPFKVFRDGDTLINVGRAYLSTTYLFIEKIAL
ncbi:hypothetical protein SAMN05421788_106255 [Filimonas lacunae]|uniref:Uncharacterized protein n=1 Tax=Filimonas lacunae TaxID=477680 RepID=A0A173MFH2_9BACT|nr:hypothetical protein [Filimonas lacunae]BAV06188.1 hypothetical protein FLA_2204 [Filimonas lacunae]SIT25188.1 hypothetical protein SAMN05421788_106255 [Filimonas lacunae]